MLSIIRIIRTNISLIKKNNFYNLISACKAHHHTIESKYANPVADVTFRHKEKSFITTFNNNSVEFRANENNIKKYPYIWLRDHCKCSTCFNQTTEELEFDLSEIPLDIKPSSVKNLKTNFFEIICESF